MMNKEQFIAALRSKISGLPQSDIDKSLDYYSEIIDDRVEDGISEEQAVNDLGSVEEIAAQILSDTPLQKLIKEKVRPSKALRAWEIVLLVLGSPIWLPLLLAAVIIILSVYIVIWSVVIVMYSVVVSFAAGTLSGIAGSAVLVFTGNPIQALLFFGAGLICAGLTVFTFIGSNKTTVCIIKASKATALRVKSIFLKKEEAK